MIINDGELADCGAIGRAACAGFDDETLQKKKKNRLRLFFALWHDINYSAFLAE